MDYESDAGDVTDLDEDYGLHDAPPTKTFDLAGLLSGAQCVDTADTT